MFIRDRIKFQGWQLYPNRKARHFLAFLVGKSPRLEVTGSGPYISSIYIVVSGPDSTMFSGLY